MVVSKDKLSTGISGLDSLLFGGVLKGTQLLLVGAPGAGKTLLSLEILYHNADAGIPGTYLCLEESSEHLLGAFKNAFPQFDKIDDLIKTGLIGILDKRLDSQIHSKEAFDILISEINEKAISNGSQLVVVDSLSHLRPLCNDDREFTRYADAITYNFSKLGILSISVLQVLQSDLGDINMLYGTTMFDGIITLRSEKLGDTLQYLISVTKMRNADHSKTSRPYEISERGVNIFK
jgi:KaiC/GvpD/RAD55 family RecA-like ATPase